MAAYLAPGFVVSCLVDGKPQREKNKDGVRTVIVPFGTEYALRIQNKTDKRCKVEVDIDGMSCTLPGQQFILDAKGSLDLERFVDDLKKGNRFKFARLSDSGVQDPTAKENGVIRVRFYKEKTIWDILSTLPKHSESDQYGFKWLTHQGPSCSAAINCNTNTIGASADAFLVTKGVEASNGATVQGSESKQEFQSTSQDFITFDAEEIVIRMEGTELSAKPAKPFLSVNGQELKGTALIRIENGEVSVEVEPREVSLEGGVCRIGKVAVNPVKFTVADKVQMVFKLENINISY